MKESYNHKAVGLVCQSCLYRISSRILWGSSSEFRFLT